MVVLAVDPGRIGQHRRHVRSAVGRGCQGPGVVTGAGVLVPGPGHRPPVQRRIVAQGAGRHVPQDRTVEAVQDAQSARLAGRGLGDASHHRRADLPAAADLFDAGQVAGGDDGQHPLLALRGHHLVRRHARLAAGHRRDVDVHAHAPPRRRLAGGAHQSRPAQVLDPHDQLGVEQLEAGLDQPLLLVGIAHLDTRALGRLGLGVAPPEARRCQHTDPTDAVPAGRGAEQHGQVSHPRGRAQHQSVGGQHAHAENVDQRVLGVAVVEGELTADRGHADGVAVTGDAGHDALDQPLLAGLSGVPEEQGVHDGDRPGPHGEDVPQDPPHTGGRPLVGLDGRGVVVALDADGHGDPVAGVDDPGVLARAHEDVRGLGRQPLQVHPRGLVRAVLAPHDGEQGELEMVGRAPEDGLHLVALTIGQAQRAVQRQVRRGRLVGSTVSTVVHRSERTRPGVDGRRPMAGGRAGLSGIHCVHRREWDPTDIVALRVHSHFILR